MVDGDWGWVLSNWMEMLPRIWEGVLGLGWAWLPDVLKRVRVPFSGFDYFHSPSNLNPSFLLKMDPSPLALPFFTSPSYSHSHPLKTTLPIPSGSP